MKNKQYNVKEMVQKASASIKSKSAEIEKLKARLNTKEALKTKFAAALNGRKKAEVVEEIVQEVEQKLLAEGVPAEAVEQAKDIVEVAVSEAAIEAAPTAEPGIEEDVMEKEDQDELSEIAVSDDIEDEEVKSAAMKLLKNCKDKKAFGKEIVKFVKKMAARDNMFVGGSVGTTRSVGGGTKKSSAVRDLENFALGKE